MDLKTCGVCGDKALGFNFNAVTCESCKAFFRRNALANKTFKCPFSERCDITMVTRRFCQKCRLQKCFTVGMRKDYIMSEEDKVLKRQKIERNKALKRPRGGGGFKREFKKMKKEPFFDDDSQKSAEEFSDYGSENSPDSMLRNILSPQSSKCSEDGLVNNNDLTCNHNVVEAPSEVTIARDVIEEVQRTQVEDNSIESILCEAIKLEYEAYSSLAQSYGRNRELNDAERAKLNELIVANKALLAPVDDDFSNLIAQDCRLRPKMDTDLADSHLLDVINLTAVAIRRLIKMAKKINAFKNMCQEDQVALLKGGCTEMMILRSAMNYDSNKQTWQIPHIKESLSSVKTDVLKQAKGNLFQEHEMFITTFDPKWRSDENIVLILCAITLFTPDRARVVHQDVIKLEQNSYYYLLRRYLESVYPGCEAKSTFLKLIQKISELKKVNEEVINCYLDVNPSDVEPLLIEIFDLKH